MKQSIAIAVAAVAGLFVEACTTTTELGRDWSPYALNDEGIVVGSGKVPGTTTYRAVKYASGNLVFLPTLPGHATNSAHGIANDDTIVGSSSGSGVENAVFWDAGATIHDLGQLAPGWQTWATAVNNRGVIVGGALAPDRHYHAWVYDLAVGRMAPLPTLPNALDTRAVNVNDCGEIVGSISVNVPERPPGEYPIEQYAVKWAAGSRAITILPSRQFLGARPSAYDINSAGTIVGTDGTRPVIWQADTTLTLPIGTHDRGYAAALNDAGVIVGQVADDLVSGADVVSFGTAAKWTLERQLVELAPPPDLSVFPPDPQTLSGAADINESGVIVGARGDRALRFQ